MKPVHYLRSSAGFKGVVSAAYFQGLAAPRGSMRILHLKGPIEVAFQLGTFEIASSVVKYEPKDGLPGVLLLHLLLTVLHRVISNEIKAQFFHVVLSNQYIKSSGARSRRACLRCFGKVP